MSKSLRGRPGEQFLFPPSVEDWVDSDHPARLVREVVEALELKELGFREEVVESDGGRPHYSEKLLLSAWLYAYMNRVRSTRELERLCLNDVGLIWLLHRYEPDHNTLWRFWKRRRKALRRVFRKVVRICHQANLVGVILHAVDGTKIPSRGSQRQNRNLYRKNLEKWLSKVDEQLQKIEQEIESQGAGPGCRLPEELKDQQQLRERIQGALKELDEAGKDHLSVSDPESQLMPCKGKKQFAYNAQAVVDESSGLIVAEGVSSEATDTRQLLPMLEQTEQNLGETAQDTVADKGYRTDENLGEAASKKYSVLVQLYESEGESAAPTHSSRFEYDAERDCCICPLGQELPRNGQSKNRHGWLDKRYHCLAKPCGCSKGSGGRRIYITPHHEAVQQQRKRQKQAAEQEKLKKRKTIVEPVFAHLKYNGAFHRWTYFGLENVQPQWSMLCTAHNLRKLYASWVKGLVPLLAA